MTSVKCPKGLTPRELIHALDPPHTPGTHKPSYQVIPKYRKLRRIDPILNGARPLSVEEEERGGEKVVWWDTSNTIKYRNRISKKRKKKLKKKNRLGSGRKEGREIGNSDFANLSVSYNQEFFISEKKLVCEALD